MRVFCATSRGGSVHDQQVNHVIYNVTMSRFRNLLRLTAHANQSHWTDDLFRDRAAFLVQADGHGEEFFPYKEFPNELYARASICRFRYLHEKTSCFLYRVVTASRLDMRHAWTVISLHSEHQVRPPRLCSPRQGPPLRLG